MIITVTPSDVRVNLDRAVTIDHGDIPTAARASSRSPIVLDLQTAIENALHDAERWSILRGEHPQRSATIAADRDTTYQVLTYVMMTAASAGIQTFSFVTVDADWSDLWDAELETGASHRPPLQRLTIHSPDMAHRHTGQNDEMGPPKVLVAISEEGFTISDFEQAPAFRSSGLGIPVDGCGIARNSDVPVTVCVAAGDGRLVDRLDYRRLYNRLMEIREYPEWHSRWTEENAVVHIVADRDIPLDVVLRVIDVSHTVRSQSSYSEDEAFQLESEGSTGTPLFPRPILLLPRATR